MFCSWFHGQLSEHSPRWSQEGKFLNACEKIPRKPDKSCDTSFFFLNHEVVELCFYTSPGVMDQSEFISDYSF